MEKGEPHASVDLAGLSAQERLTRASQITEVEGRLAQLEAALDEWTVAQLGRPQAALFTIEAYQPVRTVEQRVGGWLRGHHGGTGTMARAR